MALDPRIVAAVEAIGRSELKLAIFDQVYYHKSRVKSVDEVAKATRLSREQVLKAGVELKKAGLFEQEKKAGVTAYRQIEYYQHNKDRIIRFVQDPSKMEKFVGPPPTVAAPNGSVSFVRPRVQRPREDKAQSNPARARPNSGLHSSRRTRSAMQRCAPTWRCVTS